MRLASLVRQVSLRFVTPGNALSSRRSSAKSVFRKKITIRFKETEYSRKLDTCGRLVIPSKLREAMRLEVGENYPFFTTIDEEGQSWLCIPCPGAETEIDKAKRLLKEAGITSLD